jgi:hypothetical protein
LQNKETIFPKKRKKRAKLSREKKLMKAGGAKKV